MIYDPVAYWTEFGSHYEADLLAGRVGSGYELQEDRLMALLERLEFASVLEVGCGFGRITSLVAARWPDRPITAIDLSADQLVATAAKVPGAELIQTTLQGFGTRRRWDLVLAVEVLMHVPPDDVAAATRKLSRLSAHHVVTVDWAVPLAPGKPIAPWNALHDFRTLLGPDALVETVGLQGIFALEVER